MATVEAVITKVERDSRNPEWVKIWTDHESIGTEKDPMSTKDPKRAQEAMGLFMSGERRLINYTSNPKTSEHGHTWQNAYFNGTADLPSTPLPEAAPPALEIPTPSVTAEVNIPTATPASSDSKDWQIAKSVAAKLVIDTLPLLEKDEQNNFYSQSTRALAWAKWIYTTPLPSDDPAPQHPDEDDGIPF